MHHECIVGKKISINKGIIDILSDKKIETKIFQKLQIKPKLRECDLYIIVRFGQ